MTILRCTIHNITFGAEGMPTHEIECPKCCIEKLAEIRAALDTVTGHRDTLLAAIRIKRTVVVQEDGQ